MKIQRVIAQLIVVASTCFAQQEVPFPKDLPPYGQEQPLLAPRAVTAKMDNGLTVWLVSEAGFPKVALAVAVRGGSAADPSDRPGVSELLSWTIDLGTKSRSSKQIAQELQVAGGDLKIRVDSDIVEISTAVLSSNVPAALTVLSDILQNASFPDAEVELAKRNLSNSLRQREKDPTFLASSAITKVLFGEHPYHVTSPTQECIAATTAADLRKIFARRSRPDQTVLVAVGDFQVDQMVRAVRATFGTWILPAELPLVASPHFSSLPEHAIFIVPRPGSVQTTLRLGTLGPLRSDSDYEAAEVANAILGGMASSRLVMNIREGKGYTYSPFSELTPFQAAGVLVTGADVRNETTGASLNEIEYELDRLATTSPTEEELLKAKRYLAGSAAVHLQARTAVAERLLTDWVDGLPPEEMRGYSNKVAGITAGEAQAAARKYFPAHHFAIVAVGDEGVIRDALTPLGIPLRTMR